MVDEAVNNTLPNLNPASGPNSKDEIEICGEDAIGQVVVDS